MICKIGNREEDRLKTFEHSILKFKYDWIISERKLDLADKSTKDITLIMGMQAKRIGHSSKALEKMS